MKKDALTKIKLSFRTVKGLDLVQGEVGNKLADVWKVGIPLKLK